MACTYPIRALLVQFSFLVSSKLPIVFFSLVFFKWNQQVVIMDGGMYFPTAIRLMIVVSIVSMHQDNCIMDACFDWWCPLCPVRVDRCWVLWLRAFMIGGGKCCCAVHKQALDFFCLDVFDGTYVTIYHSSMGLRSITSPYYALCGCGCGFRVGVCVLYAVRVGWDLIFLIYTWVINEWPLSSILHSIDLLYDSRIYKST